MNRMEKALVYALAGTGAVLTASAAVAGYLWRPRREKPRTAGRRIVCIGDSITFGAGVLWTRGRDAWVRILGRQLRDGYEVLNYGICGAMLMREGTMPYAPDFWQAAKELHAQMYILTLGTNDTRPEHWNAASYACQLKERVRELQKNEGVERICLVAPPPMYRKGEADPKRASAIPENETLRAIREIVWKCAKENDAVFIDLYHALSGHPEYMKDGVHPNRQGNQIIAQEVLRRLFQ